MADRVDLALRAGRAEHTLAVLRDLCQQRPDQVSAEKVLAVIADPYGSQREPR